MKLRRCPRCGSVELTWREYCVVHTDFDQTAAGVAEMGYHSNGGDPCKVEGLCCCGYRWIARGVTQITELRGDA